MQILQKPTCSTGNQNDENHVESNKKGEKSITTRFKVPAMFPSLYKGGIVCREHIISQNLWKNPRAVRNLKEQDYQFIKVINNNSQ